MRQPLHRRWRQVTLFSEAAPLVQGIPPEVCHDAIRALAELLLAHLSLEAPTDRALRHESEDQP